jgi:hypothetical protein
MLSIQYVYERICLFFFNFIQRLPLKAGAKVTILFDKASDPKKIFRFSFSCCLSASGTLSVM